MISSTPAIECRTSVLGDQFRPVVCCEIEHFVPSGLSVAELFAQLRPQLLVAIKEAADRDPGVDGMPCAPSVGVDFEVANPGGRVIEPRRMPQYTRGDIGEIYRHQTRPGPT